MEAIEIGVQQGIGLDFWIRFTESCVRHMLFFATSAREPASYRLTLET